jgi:hypothetical protein
MVDGKVVMVRGVKGVMKGLMYWVGEVSGVKRH